MPETLDRPKLQLPDDRPPIFVSAGLIKEEADISLYAAIPEIAAQVIGDYSLHENVPPTPPGARIFYYDEAHRAAYNAFRLRNPGLAAASAYLPESIKAVKDAGQLAIIGVTALKGEDPKVVIPELVERALSMGAAGIEINGSCPNQNSDEPLCHNVSATAEIIHIVRQRVGREPYIILKVSSLGEMTIRRYKQLGLMVDAVASINSRRALSPLRGKTGGRTIEVSDGYAGQSGPIISSLATRNVRSWLRPITGSAEFPITDSPLDVLSVGGIEDGWQGYHRVHDLGALAFGGAQAFYRAAHPEPVAKRWAAEYREAGAAAEELPAAADGAAASIQVGLLGL